MEKEMFKKEYNTLLKKEKEQEVFFETEMFKKMSEGVQEQLIGKYQETTAQLNKLLMKINTYSPDEILGGFVIKDEWIPVPNTTGENPIDMTTVKSMKQENLF